MSNVVFDISMSLDGFVTADGVDAEEPMGPGGRRLHEWAFGSDAEANEKLLRESVASAGAFICGRRTYDLSLRWWKANGPTGEARLPVVVVTHHPPADVPDDGVYTFATSGVEQAVQRAKTIAGDRQVAIMSADIGRQALVAGLVDEVSIHLVPVLFGQGTRLFDHPGTDHIQLGPPRIIETPEATHLSYRVDSG